MRNKSNIILCILTGFVVGLLMAPIVSSAGQEWLDRYNDYTTSSNVREMVLQQEKQNQILRDQYFPSHRGPC